MKAFLITSAWQRKHIGVAVSKEAAIACLKFSYSRVSGVEFEVFEVGITVLRVSRPRCERTIEPDYFPAGDRYATDFRIEEITILEMPEMAAESFDKDDTSII